MKKLGTIAAIAMGVVFVSASAFAIGIPAKLKAGKVQGNLVPAFYPGGTNTSGTGDDEDDAPAIIGTAVPRSTNCTFTQGKFKAQVGKDAAVQLKGVNCSGTPWTGLPFTGTLCAHTKVLATVMDEEIDKTGASNSKTCVTTGGDIAGKLNFATGNIGVISCVAGTCKGTLPVVTGDPCTDVDKVAEIRRLEVFDGPLFATATVLGTPLKVCCGPRQTFVGGIGQNNPLGGTNDLKCSSSANDEDDGGNQDVLGEIGTVTQGVAP